MQAAGGAVLTSVFFHTPPLIMILILGPCVTPQVWDASAWAHLCAAHLCLLNAMTDDKLFHCSTTPIYDSFLTLLCRERWAAAMHTPLPHQPTL